MELTTEDEKRAILVEKVRVLFKRFRAIASLKADEILVELIANNKIEKDTNCNIEDVSLEYLLEVHLSELEDFLTEKNNIYEKYKYEPRKVKLEAYINNGFDTALEKSLSDFYHASWLEGANKHKFRGYKVEFKQQENKDLFITLFEKGNQYCLDVMLKFFKKMVDGYFWTRTNISFSRPKPYRFFDHNVIVQLFDSMDWTLDKHQ